jgi:integrase
MTVYTNKCNYFEVLKDSESWSIDSKEKEHLKDFVNEYANGRVTGRIGKNIHGSIVDCLYKIKLPLEFFKSNVEDITEEQMKGFFDCLMQDRIKRKVRKRVGGELKFIEIGNYTKKGKDKFLKAFRLYLKYRLEDNPEKLIKFSKILSVIITHSEVEPESLSELEFEKLYNMTSNLSDRYYLLVNVWGGFRASEFHGVTINDVTLPNLEAEEEFVKIWIKHENSKTKGRMITLYGKDCLKIVSEYVEERKKQGVRHNELIYEKTHNSRKLWLRRLGKKLNLSIALHPHLFRSTCATWLVDKGILKDYSDLCIFFGWYFGSPTPSKYLNRAGIKLKTIDEKVKKSKIDDVERLLEVEQEKSRIKEIKVNKEIDELKQTVIVAEENKAIAELRQNLMFKMMAGEMTQEKFKSEWARIGEGLKGCVQETGLI